MARFREVLKNRNFFFLWLGQIISQIGDRLDQMALIGFITQRSPGKTLQLATLLSFTILPVFVVGPLAGVWVDRWDRRKTMFICDFLRGCLVLLIPLYTIDSKMSLLPLYLVVFLLFSIGRFFVPAKLAIVPELVPREQLLLANSLVNTTGMIAATVGFGLGGIVVALLGVKGGFYLDGVSFFLSSLLIFSIRLKPKHNIGLIKLGKEIAEVIKKSILRLRSGLMVSEVLSLPKDAVEPSILRLRSGLMLRVAKASIFAEIKEGIKYLLEQKQMRAIINILFLVWAALGAIYVAMIIFVQETLKSVTLDLGLLIMFLGAGLFCGSLLYGRFARRANCFKSIFSSLLGSGLMLSGFALILKHSPYFSTAAVLAFTFGLVLAPVMTATNTLIHDISSQEMLGKVFSSVEVIMHLAFLLFMFLGSSLAEFESIGRAGLLIGVGVLFASIGLIGYLQQSRFKNSSFPSLSQMERT